jgi:uncharacterized protein
MNVGPLRLLILQPTTFCNINCAYCYLDDRAQKGKMSEEVLSWALRRAFDSGLLTSSLQILWHAGEPLVVGRQFYRNASQAIAQTNNGPTKTEQWIQTNGTLIDDEWCELFLSENMRVGLSIDGPESVHDLHRVTRSGQPTFHQVMRGVSCLRKHGVEFSTLAVLTKHSLLHYMDVLDFFEEAGLYSVGFNLEEIGTVNTRWSFASQEECETLYRRFIAEAVKRHHAGRLKIREIEFILGSQETGVAVTRSEAVPLQIVTVGSNGDFSTFCPQLHGVKYGDGSTHCFGNVKDNEFIDAFAELKFLEIHRSIMDGAQKCAKSCDRHGLCGSSEPGNKYFSNGTFDSTETIYCRTRIKAVADAVERSPSLRRDPRSVASRSEFMQPLAGSVI